MDFTETAIHYSDSMNVESGIPYVKAIVWVYTLWSLEYYPVTISIMENILKKGTHMKQEKHSAGKIGKWTSIGLVIVK